MGYFHITGKRPRKISSKSLLRKILNDMGIRNTIKQSEQFRDSFKINFNNWNKAESILKKLIKDGFEGYRYKSSIHIKK